MRIAETIWVTDHAHTEEAGSGRRHGLIGQDEWDWWTIRVHMTEL
jgi:hypothetical protein